MRLYTEHLPFLSCIWIGSNNIVVSVIDENCLLKLRQIARFAVLTGEKPLCPLQGHSCMPMLYSVDDNGQIYFMSKLDNTQKKETAGLSAMRKFQSLDRQARNETNDNALDSVHQNTINCIRRVSDHEFSTSSLDGQLVVWDLKVTCAHYIPLLYDNNNVLIDPSLFVKLLENSIAGLKIT